MTRLIVLALLLVCLWLALQNFLQRLRSLKGMAGARPIPDAPRREISAEVLERCAACGTHVPRSRALPGPGGGGEVYCSEACRQQHAHA